MKIVLLVLCAISLSAQTVEYAPPPRVLSNKLIRKFFKAKAEKAEASNKLVDVIREMEKECGGRGSVALTTEQVPACREVTVTPPKEQQ